MDDVKLTQAQEQQILDLWNSRPKNPPAIKELAQIIGGEDLDGRSALGQEIKKFLASRKLTAKTSATRDKKTDTIELNEAHKQYIDSNANTMKPLEIAKALFANPALSNLSSEVRAVADYIKSNIPTAYNAEENEDIPNEKYVPPKTFDSVFKRTNGYLNNSLDKEKVTQAQKRGMETLINYMHNFNFIYQMNTYDSNTDRKLCEDSFVRHTYDKPDLSQEEVDQYIQLANQVVLGYKAQRRKNILEGQLETISTANDAENMKISMSLTEAIGKASTEYHQCIDRQKKLLDNLTQKRSARLDKQIKSTASILNLVEEWKMEDTRNQYLDLAEMEQEAVAEQVKTFTSMDEIKARIMGLNKDEILNG